MATRSMYEVDDVVATIFHGLMTKQPLLVVQAARELRVSLEDDLLTNVVIMAWLLCDPYKCPLTYAPTNETVYQSLCLIMSHFPSELPSYKPQIPIPMPSPVPGVGLGLGFVSTSTSISNDHDTQTILETTIQKCFDKKYAKQSIRILTMLLHKQPELCYSLLEKHGISKTLIQLFNRIVYTPLSERLIQHLVIQTMYPVSTLTAPSSATYVQKYASIWHSETIGKSARTFSIPSQALALWNLKQKHASRIQNSLQPVAINTNSTFYWETAGAPINETMETWYNTHFPDDIPDEWSREEIEKSHVYSDIETIPLKTDWQPAFLLCWS